MVLELQYSKGIEMYILSRKEDTEKMFNEMYLSLYPYMQTGRVKNMGLQEFKDLYSNKANNSNHIAIKELSEEEEERLLDELDNLEFKEGGGNNGSI